MVTERLTRARTGREKLLQRVGSRRDVFRYGRDAARGKS